ncbi:hypothetical protein FOC4_g10014760, partial [Fusarium odoratissimum]
FSSSSSQMSPDAAGGVIDTRVWGTGQSTSLSGALVLDCTALMMTRQDETRQEQSMFMTSLWVA